MQILVDEFDEQMEQANVAWLQGNLDALPEQFDDGYTPLYHAVMKSSFEFASNLISGAGAYHDETGQTALILAATNNFHAIAPLLLKREARIKDFDGKTALMHAVASHSGQMIELLVDYEADMTDARGYNAAMQAIEPDVRYFLLYYEVDKLTHEQLFDIYY